MGEAFLKLCKSRITEELMEEPSCFMLLTQIAYRAKRTASFSLRDLTVGEALVGDYERIGLTRQKYRTSLKKLEEWGLITIRSTNRGTVAKLINKDVFDINEVEGNHQINQSVTTNKNKKLNTHEGKGKFGQYRMVELTAEEYRELEGRFGKDKLNVILEQLDEKLAEGKEKSRNHFITIVKYSRHLRENKIVEIGTRNRGIKEVKSASFQKKTKEQLYGEA